MKRPMSELLTDADRAELRGLGQGQVPAVVERIVARHVATAKAEALRERAERADAALGSVMDVQRAIEVLKQIRDDSTTPMNTAADIDQVLVELLDVRDEDE